MNTKAAPFLVAAWLVIAIFPHPASAAAIADGGLIFDSYTPPNQGGFSSANRGSATEIFVSNDVLISEFRVLTEMFQPGELRFAVFSYPDPQFIILTDPIAFGTDPAGVPSWRSSGPIDVLLEAGNTYLFGTFRSVSLNTYVDYIPETQNGITTTNRIHVLDGFANPSYDRVFNTGANGAIQLFAVPEPSLPALAAAFLFVTGCRRRR